MENKALLRKTGLNFGLYLGLASIALSIIMYVSGMYDLSGQAGNRWIANVLSFGITITFVILAYNAFKKNGDGFMTFGEGFKLSFTTIIISALVGLIWLAVYMFVLEPGYQEVILDAQVAQMEERGFEGDAVDMALTWTERMTSPLFMLLWTVVTSAIFGLIVSLLMSAFFQKKRPMWQGENTIDSES